MTNIQSDVFFHLNRLVKGSNNSPGDRLRD